MDECTGLENRRGCKASGGSNPPASAMYHTVHGAAMNRMVHGAAMNRMVHGAAMNRMVHGAAMNRMVHGAASKIYIANFAVNGF